jgi:GNAT superfamily N-acetyltransferase
MSSSHYTIRPFGSKTSDMSAITQISAEGNEHDELTNYMRRHIRSKWTSYRGSCGRWLKGKLATPGNICYVAESSSTREVVGWALWTRHGKSARAEEWQRPNRGLLKAVERRLLELGDAYYKYVPNVDPTADHAHLKELMPVLRAEWPEEIFGEFWELDGLYISPAHYRSGIGRMLVSWGVEKGREENVPVLVRSSPMGKKLYESVGFGVVQREEGFDAYIPEFIEDLKVKDKNEAKGCWALCWQPDGTDFLQRARMKAEEGKGVAQSDTEGVKTA